LIATKQHISVHGKICTWRGERVVPRRELQQDSACPLALPIGALVQAALRLTFFYMGAASLCVFANNP
jgi:hypothetical protein